MYFGGVTQTFRPLHNMTREGSSEVVKLRSSGEAGLWLLQVLEIQLRVRSTQHTPEGFSGLPDEEV